MPPLRPGHREQARVQLLQQHRERISYPGLAPAQALCGPETDRRGSTIPKAIAQRREKFGRDRKVRSAPGTTAAEIETDRSPHQAPARQIRETAAWRHAHHAAWQ